MLWWLPKGEEPTGTGVTPSSGTEVHVYLQNTTPKPQVGDLKGDKRMKKQTKALASQADVKQLQMELSGAHRVFPAAHRLLAEKMPW